MSLIKRLHTLNETNKRKRSHLIFNVFITLEVDNKSENIVQQSC